MPRSSSGQIRKWRKLVEISKLLVSALERDEALRRIVEAAPEFVGGKAAALCLVDETDHRLRVQAVCGIPPSSLIADPVVVDKDINKTIEAAARAFEADSHIGCPLTLDKEFIGALIVYDPDPEAVAGGEEFLALLADQAAIAVHNADMHERVAQKRRMLRALMEWIPDGVLLVDTPGMDVRLVSRAGLQMIGGPLDGMANLSEDGTGEWGIFDAAGELVPLEELPPIRAGLRGEITRDAEYTIRRRDGSEVVTLCNAGSVKDEAGKVTGGVLAFRDISSRKALEQEIADQKALMETMFEHMPVGLALCDAESLRIISANPAAASMFGVNVDDMIGRPPTEYSPKIDGHYLERICRKALANDAAMRFQRFQFVLPSTGRRYVDGFLVPISSEPHSERRLLAVFTDVTNRVRAQKAVEDAHAEAERRAAELEAVITSIGDGVIVVDRAGQIAITNDAARRLVPASKDCSALRDWLASANAREMDGGIVATDRVRTAETLVGEAGRNVEILVNGASGPNTVLSAKITPIRNTRDEVVAAVSVIRDVTREKETTERARVAYEVEHRISERLQRAFRPRELPKVNGWEIAAAYHTAGDRSLLGGDAYDVFEMRGGKVGVLIADVSGKGAQAAGQGATIRFMTRSYAREADDPAEVLGRLGPAVLSELGDEDFVTLFFGVLDPVFKTFTYVNAGHEQPLHLSHMSGVPARLDVTARAMGLFEPPAFASRQTVFAHGDYLVLYTDGVTDARGAQPRMGVEGLEELVSNCCGLSAESVADCILGEVRRRAGDSLPDDVAIVILRALH